MSELFQWPVRVYYEDTDAQGIVYYANYLKFLERARTEWLRSLGVDQCELRDHHDALFVVAETNIQYLIPARLDDELFVSVEVVEKGRASFTLRQQIVSAGSEPKRMIDSRTQVACLRASSLKVTRLPKNLPL